MSPAFLDLVVFELVAQVLPQGLQYRIALRTQVQNVLVVLV